MIKNIIVLFGIRHKKNEVSFQINLKNDLRKQSKTDCHNTSKSIKSYSCLEIYQNDLWVTKLRKNKLYEWPDSRSANC